MTFVCVDRMRAGDAAMVGVLLVSSVALWCIDTALDRASKMFKRGGLPL